MKNIYYTDTGLEIKYLIHKDSGDYLQPPHNEIEIISICYNDIDITDLMYETSEPYLETLIEKIEDDTKRN